MSPGVIACGTGEVLTPPGVSTVCPGADGGRRQRQLLAIQVGMECRSAAVELNEDPAPGEVHGIRHALPAFGLPFVEQADTWIAGPLPLFSYDRHALTNSCGARCGAELTP